MNTTEGNKMIAEFMGMVFLHTHIDSHGYEQYGYSMPDQLSMQVYGYKGATCYLDEQFTKSWDWLMPVIERIESMDFETYIGYAKCLITRGDDEVKFWGYTTKGDRYKLEAVYSAVIQFITYFNQTNPVKKQQV